MIKVENIDVWGFEHAIRGMRNPMNSWNKSDSYKTHIEDAETMQVADFEFFIGSNDLELMRKLFKAGPEHRKYARQIFVSMDITAPLYWWKEFDTYKVGTVANSCSTMHKIQAKEITTNDFSIDNLQLNLSDAERISTAIAGYMAMLEDLRAKYNETKDKKYWRLLIQLLPASYNQRRTITMTYENVFNMIHQRNFHKLDEWPELAKVLKNLPYIEDIMGGINE